MSQNLEADFEAAVLKVKENQLSFEVSNQDKLEMYALYKQATAGDVVGEKPAALDMVGRAKYAAWSELVGMVKEDAMRAYIDLIQG